MTTKSTILSLFDFKIPVERFDLTAIHTLDKDRRVKIELTDGVIRDHYRAFRVEIVSKTHGKIDAKLFQFADYLGKVKRGDTRREYPGPYEIIGYCGWKWYIAVPTTTRPLTEAIEKYIGQFR